MALVVYDRVQETTATTGTGSITLGGAVAGYQTFAVVGNGNTTYYTILNGSAWEVGIGTYSTSGPTLARTTVLANSNGNTSPITLSGSSSVWVDYPAGKAIYYDASGVATIGSTLNYSDTGIIGSFASTVAGYNQVIIQNKSSASNASTNFNVSNDVSTATSGYAELGINSSTYAGSGSFNIAGSSYLASASTDLTIGTYGAYNLHFVTNSSTTDAMTIYNSGGVSLGGQPDPGLGTLYANNVYLGFNAITAAAGTTVLTNASSGYQNVVGTTTQTIQLPVATTLYKGLAFTVANASTGNVTIKDSASTTIDTIVTGGTSILVLTNNGTSAGTWVAYSYLPASYDFSTSTANFGNATITNATYQGNTIASGYGGTGLTTFTAANNAIYSTSASALAAGTLPIAAGGTAATTFTANGVIYGNGTSALGATAAGTTGQVLQANTGGAPTWATTYAGTVTSVAQSFTGGLISVAGSPITTSGTLALTVAGTSGGIPYFSSGTTWASSAALTQYGVVYGGGAGASPVATAAGTTGQVLIATTSGAPSWGAVPSTAAVTSFSAGTTGFTPSSATTGAVTLAGTLNVANGGTGLTTLTAGYIPFGNGTSAFGNSSNFFWDNTNARLGIGTATPAYAIDVYDQNNATFGFREFSAADGPTIRLYRAQGTIASPTPPTTGQSLGGLRCFGYTGAAFGTLSAAIDLYANQTFAVGSQGSYINFRTTADSTASATEKMRIFGSGGVSIGNTTDPSANNLSVTGSVTAASFSGAGTGLTGTASSLSIGGTSANVTGTVAIANGGTGNTTGFKLFDSSFTSNINANTNRTVGAYGSYASSATNTPTNSGILYSFTSATDGSGDGGQFWQDYVTNNLYLRQRWGGTYGSWTTMLSANNYNSYAPTLTGTGASGTWGISVTGNAATATTATNQSGGTVSATTVQATGGFTATSAAPFYLNATTVSSNFTSPANYNLMSAGPITINTGVTVTIDTTGTWVIV
jgi:hypothetical protein